METMIWVAVIVIAAILEGMSAQLISIWFVGGGIAGMIAQLCWKEQRRKKKNR